MDGWVKFREKGAENIKEAETAAIQLYYSDFQNINRNVFDGIRVKYLQSNKLKIFIN